MYKLLDVPTTGGGGECLGMWQGWGSLEGQIGPLAVRSTHNQYHIFLVFTSNNFLYFGGKQEYKKYPEVLGNIDSTVEKSIYSHRDWELLQAEWN